MVFWRGGLSKIGNRFANIYISGSIRKGDQDTRTDDFFWTKRDLNQIQAQLDSEAKLLNPANTKIDRRDELNNFGCDLFLVSISDVILVDLRRKKGIGVGAELMLANHLRIPVIGILGPHSEYFKKCLTNVSGQELRNWTHPFARGMCDHLCQDIAGACDILNTEGGSQCWTNLYSEKIRPSIEHFKEHNKEIVEQYERDSLHA